MNLLPGKAIDEVEKRSDLCEYRFCGRHLNLDLRCWDMSRWIEDGVCVGQTSSGSVLLIVLVVLTMLASLALTVGAYVSSNIRLASFLLVETKAEILAGAGLKRAEWEIQHGNDWVFKERLGVGQYIVYVTNASSLGIGSTNYFGYSLSALNLLDARFCGRSLGICGSETVRVDFVFDGGGRTLYRYRH